MAQQKQESESIEKLKEKEFAASSGELTAQELLDDSMTKLSRVGGYDLMEMAIDGAQNMNPERKARKKIFLSESTYKDERETFIKNLHLWEEVVSSSDSVIEMIEKCEENADKAEIDYKKNIAKAVEAVKDLEKSYRSVSLFFKNAESNKIKEITFVNAAMDQLTDLDDTRFIDAIQEELVSNYDRLDLRDNYSLLVVPGYLGSNKVVEKWAKMAHENKVMMVTDFEHLDTPDDVMAFFNTANLTGGDVYRSNIIMTCNYLVGRDRHREVGEQEELFVPPSTALAGTIYKTLMSQPAAGKKHGSLSEVDGVRFDLKKQQIAELENMGLIPMVNEFGKVLAMSAKTLFNGDNLGLQNYAIVRVFDYVTKVLVDFLNRRAFENFNSQLRLDILSQINRFLDSVTGPNKLIEKFSIKRFEQDRKQKDRIYLDIHMTPFFAAKSFMIKLDGQKGDDGNEWETNYE